jgi:hypothetical protein
MTSRMKGLSMRAMDDGRRSSLCRGRRAVDDDEEVAAPRNKSRSIENVYKKITRGV